MYKDAVKTTGFEDRITVKDLIEIVGEALEINNSDSIKPGDEANLED